MNVGYIRVSTTDQNADRQLTGIELDRVFQEKVSASTIDRPELNACLDFVREGDTLWIHSLDRICRSGAGDAVALVERMTAKGVSVCFHKDGMRFDGIMSAAQKGILSILASVAEMERGLIRERQREGIAAAKARGQRMGRPKKNVTKDDAVALIESGMAKIDVAKKLGIGRATLYRLLAE